MSVERRILVFAGTMVFVSGLLVLVHSRWWALLTLFVGFNMFQSAFTGFCPAAIIMRGMGAKSEAELAVENKAQDRNPRQAGQ